MSLLFGCVNPRVHSVIQKWPVQLPMSNCNFGWLPESMKCLETQRLPLQESMEVMKNAHEKHNADIWESGESVSTNL
jgi:hypothetical protein